MCPHSMVLIRQATPAEMVQPVEFTTKDAVALVDSKRFLQEAAAGRFRPEWTWFAEDGVRIVGRALWWGRADSERPVALDCLYVLPDVPDRTALATELLLRAQGVLNAKPEFNVTLRGGRRSDDPDIADAVAWRSEAAKAVGLTDVVERLRYEWTRAAGVPAPSRRLVFRPAADDEFLAAFRQVAVGSLDVATQRSLAVMDADEQARDDLAFYRSCPGERSWWRLAATMDGELVGFAIPSATPYHRNVGYLGVVPERRGQGYVDDLLSEITRGHAADGADRITATTDVLNTPMAAAFDRAKYQVTEVRIVFAVPAR
jgi:RimJ/RimL family protein N-acetyltransferase